MEFICDLCQNKFNGKGYLLRHMERFHLKFSCVACNLTYSQKRNFLDHLRSHFEKFICNYCGLKIYRLEKLEQHVLTVHEPTKRKFTYSCRHCTRKFPNAIFRNSHERDVHKGRDESAFKCKLCGQTFLKKDQLRLHSLENHYKGCIFFCPFKECDRYFKSSKLLKTHEKIHGPANYECLTCRKKFQQSSNFSKHKKRCRGPVEVKNVTEEELEKISVIAQEQFLAFGGKIKGAMKLLKEDKNSESRLTDKIENRDEKKGTVKLEEFFSEIVCSTKVKKSQIPEKAKNVDKTKQLSLPPLNLSPQSKLRDDSPSRSNTETICDLCGLKISKISNLNKHMSLHHTKKLFNCPEQPCKLSFSLKGNLLKHIRQIHLKQRPFQCDKCGKALKTKHHLTNHMKTHNEPEMCPICSISLPNIEAHIKRHQQVKTATFVCPQCSRECATKQVLQEHIQRIHERKPLGKLYTCSVCDENFIRNSDLRRHSFVHYQGKIFSCTQPGCCEMFKTSYKLQLHQAVHNKASAKSFVCEICNKSYPRQTALYKHKKIHSET